MYTALTTQTYPYYPAEWYTVLDTVVLREHDLEDWDEDAIENRSDYYYESDNESDVEADDVTGDSTSNDEKPDNVTETDHGNTSTFSKSMLAPSSAILRTWLLTLDQASTSSAAQI